MSKARANGRTVRNLNSQTTDSIAAAKMALWSAADHLSQTIPERDRVKIMREVRDALMDMNKALSNLEDASVNTKSIDEICVIEAQRGSYKKS
jgi:acyl-CoA reductase-like NAD-dependent aldehyde dehydrogenase